MFVRYCSTLRLRNRILFKSSIKSMSTSSTQKESFSGEVTELYAVLAKQHLHENGPWNKMISAAQAALSSSSGKGSILDVASGPGEPGLSIAKLIPCKYMHHTTRKKLFD